MSALLMGRVFYTELPAHLKLTLLALADHANDDGEGVKVGQERLAKKVGASVRAVRRHIIDLRESGYLEKLERRGSHGVDRHRIAVEKLPTDEQIKLFRPDASGRSANLAGRPSVASSTGHPASLDRTPVSAEPSVEPSERPVRKRDLIHDALAEVEGADPIQLTRPHARRIAVAAAAIRSATPDLLPAEIHRRAAVYRRLHPEWELTANALASHWASLSGLRSAPTRAPREDPDGAYIDQLREAGVLRG